MESNRQMARMYSPPTRSFAPLHDGSATPAGMERTLVDPDPPAPIPGPRSASSPVPRPVRDPASRRPRRFVLLSCWSSIWFLIFNLRGGYSWHYFTQGSTLLFKGAAAGRPAGGMHLYANYPQLQIGPFTFAAAQLLRQVGTLNGRIFAESVMTLLGLAVLYVIERIALSVRPTLASDPRLELTLRYGGAAFMIGWVDLAAAYGHLDDVLALFCVTLAVWALVSEFPALAGICLGLSADAKPWALVFLPLILAVPGRIRRHAAIWTAVTVVAAWLPFVVADLHTLTVAQFTITNEPSSALRALGVTAPSTPWWDRAAQIGLGCALGALAVYRRRWPAVILLGVGARIALDPGVYGYYTAGVLLRRV